MTKDELRKGLEATGHAVVENRLSPEELESIERELDETVEKMKAKAAEMGMPYQAVARKVLQAAFA